MGRTKADFGGVTRYFFVFPRKIAIIRVDIAVIVVWIYDFPS
jgi:hypothetical protein